MPNVFPGSYTPLFFTSSTLPAAADLMGSVVYLTDTKMLAFSDGTSWISLSSLYETVNTVTSSPFNLAAGSDNSTLVVTNATATVIGLPPNTSVALPVGYSVKIIRQTNGAVTITPGSGVTLRNPFSFATLRSPNSVAYVTKIGTNEWVLEGDVGADTVASGPAVTNIWSGATTTSTATVSVLTGATTPARIVASTSSDLSSPIYGTSATTGSDGITKLSISGLAANTQYHYGIETNGALQTIRGKFRTTPSSAASFSFAFGSCVIPTTTSNVFARIAARNPTFFIATGDAPYIDEPSVPASANDYYSRMSTFLNGVAKNVYANMPTYYMWSDHDFYSDGATGSSIGTTNRNRSLSFYRARVPHPTLRSDTATDDVGQTFVVGRVRFILLDCRSYASAIGSADNSSKTKLGTAQKAWLKTTLSDAVAANQFVVISVDVPWIASTDNDTWFGYSTERTELADYMKSLNMEGRVMIIAGDAHMLAFDSGANADYATGGGMDIPVFHAASLDRDSSVKGGPYSGGSVGGTGQYGLISITDTGGSTLSVTYTGYNSSDSAVLTHTFTSGDLTGAANDTTPNAFTFTDVTNATISTEYTSNTITVAGINAASAVTITGGTYSKNSGAYTASAGTVVNGDTISVRVTSSGSASTAVNATLTIGGVSDTYSVTTAAATDTTPNAFTFTDVTNASVSTQYTSNTITVAGINAPAAISITGGTYAINAGSYTSASGTVSNGDTVTVRVTSSASNSTAASATLTIGGVSDTYTVTTAAVSGAVPTVSNYTSAGFRHATVNQTSGTLNLTFTPTVGRALVLFVTPDKNCNIPVPPTGFTQVIGEDSGTGVSGWVFVKIADGTESALTTTWNAGQANGVTFGWHASCLEISGANSASPVDVVAEAVGNKAVSTNRTSGTATTTTTSGPNRLALAFWACDSVASVDAATGVGFSNGFTMINSAQANGLHFVTTNSAGAGDTGNPPHALATLSVPTADIVSTAFSWTGDASDENILFVVTIAPI